MLNPGSKIIVGMSGGVDSSVTAYLLKQQGFDVCGVFMKNWEDDTDGFCPAETDFADAKAVAQSLAIPIHAVNFSDEYWTRVFNYFLDEYQAGRTPNPDILCNREIKFKAFLQYALDQGAARIATGHYARLEQTITGVKLLKGIDTNKDQSYFLSALNQQQLSKSLFPLGTLTKPQVRALAAELKLTNHAKKDSTGICFIGERKFKTFLQEYLLNKPGPIATTDSRILGEHQGLMYYTLGQRQGLNIGGLRDANGQPWYVVDKDMNTNTLIVAQGTNHPRLYASGLICHSINWIEQTPPLPLTCHAKIRYRQQDTACTLSSHPQGYQVHFDEPQRAITPGQFVVFYQEDECLGGGVIECVTDRCADNTATSATPP
jgi:tRNA-uridine 2-sulfurtransferase